MRGSNGKYCEAIIQNKKVGACSPPNEQTVEARQEKEKIWQDTQDLQTNYSVTTG